MKKRLCTVHCFGASESMLSGLTIEKERLKNGVYAVKCMISALNTTTTEAFIYAEFERVGESLVKKTLEKLGAKQVQVNSYSLGDFLY